MTNDDLERRLRAAVAVVDPLSDAILEGLVDRRRRTRRRGRTAGGVLVALFAIVGLIIGLAPSGNSTKVQVVGNLPVHRHAPRTVPVPAVPTVHLRASSFRPVGPVFTFGSWFTAADGAAYVVAFSRENTVVDRIDTVTGAVTASAKVAGGPSYSPPVFAANAIWVGTKTTIYELDPSSLRVVRASPIAPGLTALAAAGGHLWVVSAGRLYDTSFDRIALVPVEPELFALNVVANQAGTALAIGLPGSGGIDDLDPDTARVLAHYPLKGLGVTIAGIAGQTAWGLQGSGYLDDAVGVRLPTGRVVHLSGLDDRSGAAQDLVWSGHTLLLAGDKGADWCLDPATGRAEVRIVPPNILDRLPDQVVGDWFYVSGPKTQLLRARVTGCG